MFSLFFVEGGVKKEGGYCTVPKQVNNEKTTALINKIHSVRETSDYGTVPYRTHTTPVNPCTVRILVLSGTEEAVRH